MRKRTRILELIATDPDSPGGPARETSVTNASDDAGCALADCVPGSPEKAADVGDQINRGELGDLAAAPLVRSTPGLRVVAIEKDTPLKGQVVINFTELTLCCRQPIQEMYGRGKSITIQ